MMQSNITAGVMPATCPVCGTPFSPSRRSQRTCSNPCKQSLLRTEKRIGKASKSPSRLGSYQTPQKPQFARPQAIDIDKGCNTLFGDLDGTAPLEFTRINDVTWRVSDGKKIRHTAGMGMPGSDQPRALAWLMDVGWGTGKPAWMVRCGSVAFGPTTFTKAKRAAELLLRGGLEEPVMRLLNPTAYLTHVQAELSEGRA